MEKDIYKGYECFNIEEFLILRRIEYWNLMRLRYDDYFEDLKYSDYTLL